MNRLKSLFSSIKRTKMPDKPPLAPDSHYWSGLAVPSKLLELRSVCGGHTQKSFAELYATCFENAHSELLAIMQMTAPAAEDKLPAVLEEVIRAVKARQGYLLPAERPGSNYRAFEQVYTYALVTAILTEALLAGSDDTAALRPADTAQIRAKHPQRPHRSS